MSGAMLSSYYFRFMLSLPTMTEHFDQFLAFLCQLLMTSLGVRSLARRSLTWKSARQTDRQRGKANCNASPRKIQESPGAVRFAVVPGIVTHQPKITAEKESVHPSSVHPPIHQCLLHNGKLICLIGGGYRE